MAWGVAAPLFGVGCEERGGREDRDRLVSAEREQVVVSGDDVVLAFATRLAIAFGSANTAASLR
jgi:hypothetical protein